jgi:hypothetical protein
MESFGSVQSRQRTEDLFGVPRDSVGNQILLTSAQAYTLPAQPADPGPAALGVGIDGYAVISFYALADKTFTIALYEAVESDGPYVLAQTLTSAVVNGVNRISTRVASNAKFMYIVITNTDVTTQGYFSFKAFGIPIATAGA